MDRIRIFGLCLIALFSCFFNPNATFAQKDTLKSAGVGMDKVELLLKDVLNTQSFPSGRSYNYTSQWPYARINGGEPLEIDGTASVLIKPFMNCAPASNELTQYAKARKMASHSLVMGIGTGVVLAVGGFLLSNKIDPDEGAPGVFFSGIGLGFGSMVTGVVLGMKQNTKAKEHLRQSVILYNEQCFIGLKTPALKDSVAVARDTVPKTMPGSGVIDHYKDTAFVEILRNAPEKTGFWSIGATLLNLDLSGTHFFTLRYGAEVQYQSPKFGLRGNLNLASLDNFHDLGYNGQKYVANPYVEGYEYRDIAVADDYQKAMEASLQSWICFGGKTRIKNEEVILGTSKQYGANVKNIANFQSKIHKNWAVRFGGMYYRSIQQSENKIPFITDAPDITVIDPDTGNPYTYSPYEAELGHAAVMLRSYNLTLGLGRRSHHDLKFHLKNTENKGVHNRYSMSEWYVDALFAPSLELGRVDYFIYSYNPSAHELHNISVAPTPLINWGARIGWRVEAFTKNFGWGYKLELGSRPGIKSSHEALFNSYLEIGIFCFFGKRQI